MGQETVDKRPTIDPEMTILDVVSRFRKAEAVFKQYDEQAGECLCCHALFDSLKDAADKYHLDLQQLISDIEAVIEDNEIPA